MFCSRRRPLSSLNFTPKAHASSQRANDFMKRYKQKLLRIQSGKKAIPAVIQKYLVSQHGGKALFDLAVTLPTYAKEDVIENPSENHCRLEFLGDRVLELALTSILIDRAPKHWDIFLISSTISLLVSNSFLEGVGKKLFLDEFIENELEHNKVFLKAIADTFEAVLAAIFIVNQRQLQPCIDFLLESSVMRDNIDALLRTSPSVWANKALIAEFNKDRLGEEMINYKQHTVVQASCLILDKKYTGTALTNASARRELMNTIYKELFRGGRGALIASRADEVEMILNLATGKHDLYVQGDPLFSFDLEYSVQYVYDGSFRLDQVNSIKSPIQTESFLHMSNYLINLSKINSGSSVRHMTALASDAAGFLSEARN